MHETFSLYLVRHAVAADRGDAWPDDAKRPLTASGISRFRRQARGLAALGVGIDQVLSSPLVRTRQTADILAEALSTKPPIVEVAALAPGGTYAEVIAELAKRTRRSEIALVGHEPGIGELAARLVGAKAAFVFKKGAVCRIDVDALPPTGPGHLRWFATPRMLRALGK
jgi:phosphohistidine phosphatase